MCYCFFYIFFFYITVSEIYKSQVSKLLICVCLVFTEFFSIPALLQHNQQFSSLEQFPFFQLNFPQFSNKNCPPLSFNSNNSRHVQPRQLRNISYQMTCRMSAKLDQDEFQSYKAAFHAFDWNNNGKISSASLQVETQLC